MNIFEISTIIIAFLYIIYDNNTLPYYFGLINKNFFKTSQYFDFCKNSPIQLNYLEFIFKNDKGFLANLLICPNCFSVWLVILANILCNLEWLNIGYEAIMVWIGYTLLRFIIKKLYE